MYLPDGLDHLVIEDQKGMKKKAQHTAVFKPMTFQLLDKQAGALTLTITAKSKFGQNLIWRSSQIMTTGRIVFSIT